MFEKGLTFDDVFLVPGYNGIRSRQDVSTETRMGDHSFKIPVMSSNMDTITGVQMAKTMADLGGVGILHRFCSIEENLKMYQEASEAERPVAVSLGVNEGLERLEALESAGCQMFCIDVAHGHSKLVNKMIKSIRSRYGSNLVVIAGNVATYAGADYLAAAGADAIKVGIGPGSVCSTRMKTGFGVPQLTALLDCRRVDRALIADGGIRRPGDAVKALAAGADFVMCGGFFAGTEETPGEVVEKRDDKGKARKVKLFRGMASREAQEDFMGQMSDWKTAEGVQVEVPFRGSVKEKVADLMGGIRSGLTYCGAEDLSALQRKANFMEVSPAGRLEGEPHALLSLKEE
jgi:IMP dehydrogenase